MGLILALKHLDASWDGESVFRLDRERWDCDGVGVQRKARSAWKLEKELGESVYLKY